jgi:hypothetical protein
MSENHPTKRGHKPTHGNAFKGKVTKEYSAWVGMHGRCFNPKNHKYADYGGRGITVCDRWRYSFENFLADMGRKPSLKHSLGRIDNDGNYEPGNCRWETIAQQTRNRRSNRLLTIHGETLCLTDWAKRYGLPPRTVLARVRDYGWTIERALTTPLGN